MTEMPGGNLPTPGTHAAMPHAGLAYWTGTLPGRLLGVIACTALFAMMMLTFADVIGRYFFASPVPAAYELISLIMPLIIFCALPYVNLTQGHVTIDLLDGFVPGGLLRWQMLLVHLVSTAALGLIAWRLAIASQDHHEFDGVTNELYLPLWPFSAAMSVLCIIGAITMVAAGLDQWRAHSRAGSVV
ncbi:MAG: TRAP transporter small permease [Burkholderiaceae bacterium]